LDWDTEEETFTIASTQRKLCPAGRSVGLLQPPLMAIGLFKVWPMEFVGMFEITADVSFCCHFYSLNMSIFQII